MWIRISNAALIGESVYVVDARDPSVRQFSMGGEFLAELGRSGAGPGEFAHPTIVALHGDSIGVWDLAQRRWAFFDQQGNHLRTREIPTYPQMRYPALHRPFGKVNEFYSGLTAWVVDDNVAYAQALVQWSVPTAVDTVALVPQGAIMALTGRQWNRVSQGFGPVGGVDVMGDSLIVFVDGSESEMVLYLRTEAGLKMLDTKALPGRPTPLTARDKDDLVERLVRGGPPEMAQFEYRLPDVIPAWTAVNTSSDGTVWLRRGGTGEVFGTGESWVQCTLNGGKLGELTLPTGITLLDVEGSRLVGMRRGEFDELYLQLFQIEGLGR